MYTCFKTTYTFRKIHVKILLAAQEKKGNDPEHMAVPLNSNQLTPESLTLCSRSHWLGQDRALSQMSKPTCAVFPDVQGGVFTQARPDDLH